MASVVWMAVFILLMIELFITGLLVLPLPRLIRRFIAKKIFTYDLAKRVRFLSNFIILGLVLAVSDAITTLRRLEQKLDMSSEGVKQHTGEARTGYIEVSMDKQRKFRAERNMYLAGFALTLMFVIARIVELMQQNTEHEDEKETLSQRLKDIGDSAEKKLGGPITDISTATESESTLRKRSGTATENTDKRD